MQEFVTVITNMGASREGDAPVGEICAFKSTPRQPAQSVAERANTYAASSFSLSSLSSSVLASSILLFEIGAFLGLDLIALLALGVELFFSAQQFNEGLFSPVALLKSSPHDAEEELPWRGLCNARLRYRRAARRTDPS